MQIAPGVHQVRMIGADTFVIAEKRITLIDAGLPGSRRVLERRLHAIGRSLDELERIICTHAHPDHIGGVTELVAGRDDVEVLMHPADIAGLGVGFREALAPHPEGATRRGRLIQYLTRTPERIAPIDHGDELPLLGGLRVVHTPGHTPGSVCLYAPRHRLLFSGDVLQVIRGRLTYASSLFSHDIALARATIARLAELDVDTIALSHYRPWRADCRGALQQLAERAVG